MNEIHFGDAVESDTIAEMLERTIGWTVTVNQDGTEIEGSVMDVTSHGILLGSGYLHEVPTFIEWTEIDSVTIH